VVEVGSVKIERGRFTDKRESLPTMVVLFSGGLSIRCREDFEAIPKPLINTRWSADHLAFNAL
jgi:hypothetical protein